MSSRARRVRLSFTGAWALGACFVLWLSCRTESLPVADSASSPAPSSRAVEAPAIPTIAYATGDAVEVEAAVAEATVAAATPAIAPTSAIPRDVTSAEILGSASAASSASATGSAQTAEAVDPLIVTLSRDFVKTDFSKSPFYFTAAFDGSLRFTLWIRELAYARTMKQKHGKMPHLTFFVNGAFYSTKPGKSDVGKAMSRAEILVRRALTQQAINEGHDIADHGMGHHDGRLWTKAEWLEEIDRFRGTMMTQLFNPVAAEEGGHAFPRFTPLEGAEAGATGAACDRNDTCASGVCLPLTDAVRVCTQPCNLKAPCPAGTACGAPMFRQDTDVCVPVPSFPIEVDGAVLFNEKGEPNRKHSSLKPYAIIGYRAPYLAANDALYEALVERGYRYDTSQSASPGPPFYFTTREAPKKILQFPLMLYPGSRTIPMDYNYAHLKVSGERMKEDYERSILGAYAKSRIPWNVGHHFAMWEDGAYLGVLEWAVDHVLGGCPDQSGSLQCEGGEVVSFRDLAQRLE